MIILLSFSLAYFIPPSYITSWCFPDIYVRTKHYYLMIGKPQWQPCVFYLFVLQQSLNNNTLFFKLVDIKYSFQNFDQCYWLSTLLYMGTFPFNCRTCIFFSRWRQCGISWYGCGGYCIIKRERAEIIFPVCLIWMLIIIIISKCLQLWLVLLYNPADDTSFSPAEVFEALLRWVFIEVSKHGGNTTVVFELVLSFKLL